MSLQSPDLRVAVVSDIHGNLPALQAVAQDIERRACDMVLDCGDLLSGPLWPADTAAWLRRQAWPTVAGNHERQLLACALRPGERADMLAYAELDAQVLDWLRSLPLQLRPAPGVLMLHGRPDSDLEYLLESVGADAGVLGARLADEPSVRERLCGIDPMPELLVCGHSHQPRAVRVDGCLIVNPGSVGLPAFDDDHGGYHRIETGSPHARYALCERRAGRWNAALLAVDYDWERSATKAAHAGMPDWARWLRSGRS